MKQEDLDLIAQMLEDQPELLEMSKTTPIEGAVQGSSGIKSKTRLFDKNIDKIAQSLGNESIDVDLKQKALDKAKSFLTEARTRASMSGANPEMYKKLGREALDKAKEAASTVAGKALKPSNIIKGIAGPAMFLASEAADAAETGPASGTDESLMEDPTQPLEVRQAAMKRVRDKYLKPKEDRNE